MKKNYCSTRLSPKGKRTLKQLAADLDTSIIKLTDSLADYKEEIKDILKKRK